MAVWIVRAGRRGEREQFALENDVVVIGWEEVPDLSRFSTREELESAYREARPEAQPKIVPNHVGQLWAFSTRIQTGDVVVLPLKTQSAIAFGVIVGPYQYRPDFPVDAQHSRPVRWIRTDIPRSAFDQDLRSSFSSMLTVSQVRRANAEERIRAVAEERTPRSPSPTQSATGQDVPETEEAAINLEEYAQDQIQEHISQKFHGHELATLVDAILQAQGYITLVSPPGPDGGVDIIAGRGPMGFDEPRLIVQVKSGTQTVGVDVLRQLQGVLSTFNAQHGLLVSWGGFRESVHRESRQHFFSIRLWDAGTLVTELLKMYDKLPDTLQAELPLKRIWALVPEE